MILENSTQYVGVDRCIYYGRKKTNKLLVHSCRSVSWLPTHSLMSGQPRNRPVGMNLWFICLFPPTIYINIYLFIIYRINYSVIQRFPAPRKAVTTHIKKKKTLFPTLGQVDEWTAKPSRFSIHSCLSEFFGLWRLKHLKLRITYRQRRSNFSRLYKKWLITQNYVFLNKYKLYCNTIAIINKIYRDRLYNDILVKSDNTKKMWDNINLLINKKRPSSTTS